MAMPSECLRSAASVRHHESLEPVPGDVALVEVQQEAERFVDQRHMVEALHRNFSKISAPSASFCAFRVAVVGIQGRAMKHSEPWWSSGLPIVTDHTQGRVGSVGPWARSGCGNALTRGMRRTTTARSWFESSF